MLLSGAGKAFCAGYDLAHYVAGEEAERVGWQQAVRERDEGSFDWSTNQPYSV